MSVFFKHASESLKRQKAETEPGAVKTSIKKNALKYATVIVVENIKESMKNAPQKFARTGTQPDAELWVVVVDVADTIKDINVSFKMKPEIESLCVRDFFKGKGKGYDLDETTPGTELKEGQLIKVKSYGAKKIDIVPGDKLNLCSLRMINAFVNIPSKNGAPDEIKSLVYIDFGYCKKLSSGHLSDLSAMDAFPFPDSVDRPPQFIIASIRTAFADDLKKEKFVPGTCVGFMVDVKQRETGNEKTMTVVATVTIYEIHQVVDTSFEAVQSTAELAADGVVVEPQIVHNEIITEMYGVDSLGASCDEAAVAVLQNHTIPFTAVMKVDIPKTAELNLDRGTVTKYKCRYTAVEWQMEHYLSKMPVVSLKNALEYADIRRTTITKYDIRTDSNIQNLARCTAPTYKIIKDSGEWEIRAVICNFATPYGDAIDQVVDAFRESSMEVPPETGNPFTNLIKGASVLELFAVKTSLKRKRE